MRRKYVPQVKQRMRKRDTEFSASIERFAKKANVTAAMVLQKVAFGMFNALIEQSPVDTGAFRSHWRVGVNDTDDYYDPGLRDRLQMSLSMDERAGTVERRAEGLGIPPQEAIDSSNENIPRAKWGDTIYLTNRSDYGPEVDAEGKKGLNAGSSKQAPRFWVYQVARDGRDYVRTGAQVLPT